MPRQVIIQKYEETPDEDKCPKCGNNFYTGGKCYQCGHDPTY